MTNATVVSADAPGALPAAGRDLQGCENREAAACVRIAVIIPTYNNAATVASVITRVGACIPEVIVVDDGSTDGAAQILASLESITLITFDRNRGKGAALAAGFERALQEGFTHAITFDADDQHRVEDLAVLQAAVMREPAALVIGNRVPDLSATSMPPRSRLGRSFGNFWYRFITGIALHDTQCGLRAYPLQAVTALRVRRARYEYEQELLIKAAWSGMPVVEVPVRLHYLDKSDRVSHFRPVRDFMRITRVNSRYAFLRCLFPLPPSSAPGITVRQKIVALVRRELQAHATPARASASVATGVFLGLLPIHGFQVLSLLGLSFVMRLNRPLAMLGVSISSPPFLPFIIVVAVAIGRMVLPVGVVSLPADSLAASLAQGALEFAVGSCILAVGAGVASFVVLYPFFKRVVPAVLPAVKRWKNSSRGGSSPPPDAH